MRTLARLAPLALVAAALCVPPPSTAATVNVSINNFAFVSSSITVAQGTTVRWTNNDGTTHSSQSNGGFWSSPNLGGGATYQQTSAFLNAGSYGYHCRQHSHMTGMVRVPLKAPTGAANGFTLRWSSATSTPSNRGFDVQKMAPGSSTWVNLKINTQARSVFLNPTRNGTWKFRARTDNRSNAQSSGWSPTKSVSVS